MESCSVTAVGVEVLPVQKLLLGVDLHTPAKIYIDFLPVGVAWIF